MAWRPENVELELRPRYTFQNVSNSMQKNAAGNLHTYGGTFYATYNAPFGLVLSSDINFQATSGYSSLTLHTPSTFWYVVVCAPVFASKSVRDTIEFCVSCASSISITRGVCSMWLLSCATDTG